MLTRYIIPCLYRKCGVDRQSLPSWYVVPRFFASRLLKNNSLRFEFCLMASHNRRRSHTCRTCIHTTEIISVARLMSWFDSPESATRCSQRCVCVCATFSLDHCSGKRFLNFFRWNFGNRKLVWHLNIEFKDLEKPCFGELYTRKQNRSARFSEQWIDIHDGSSLTFKGIWTTRKSLRSFFKPSGSVSIFPWLSEINSIFS